MIDKTESSPEVLLKIDELIDKGENFAVALVLKAEGSTPRKAGVRAVIFETGKILGTLGGGVVEAQTQSKAIESCKSKNPVLFDVQLHGTDRQDDDPICGGSMTILVDPDAARNKAIFKQVAEAIKNRIKGVLITTVSGNKNLQVHYKWFAQDSIPVSLASCPRLELSLNEGETPSTHFPGRQNISDCLKNEAAQLFIENAQNLSEKKEVFVEPVIPKPLLVIAGGGHIGQALAYEGSIVGFDIIVLDDRPEFTSPEFFSKEATVICGDIAQKLDQLPVNKDTYIVIVTRGHQNDAEALEACIKKPFGYIGMIGSRRKVELIRKNFIQSGIGTAEEFDRIFAPIGLDIGAVTVPEIAVSITAELIAVRRKSQTHKSWDYKVSQ